MKFNWFEVKGTDGQTTVLAFDKQDAKRRVERRKGTHGIGKVLDCKVIE